VAEQRSPFQGLGFYTEDDAKWFFGRETERKIILAHLRTARLTLLYAESGVGKSSLLRAGVAARLRELAVHNIAASRSPKFIPVVFSAWKDDPVEDLIAEIWRQVQRLSPESNGAGPPRPASRGGLAEAITAAASALDATLVIILDQFEEHFSYRLGDSRPDRLADELARSVNSPDVPANFLIAVREDAYGGLGDLFSGRISNVYNNYLHLEYLTREAAREAIEKPVEIYNAEHSEDDAITLDPDLTEAVLDEVRRGNLELGAQRPDRDGGSWSSANPDQIETPFLQLVMTRLWDLELANGSRVLRTTTLNGVLGGAETIVRNHVDRALTGLAGEELETATDIFHDLVTPSGAKVAHTARDLAQMTDHPENTVGSVLDRLYEERIVRAVDPAPGTAQPRYEIFHDRLAAPILDWRRQRENARLERAKQHAEQEAEMQRTQARRFKRRARIMFGLAVSLLLLLVAVVTLLHYARVKSAVASRARRNANYIELTDKAQAQLASRPDVALSLYLAAYAQQPKPIIARDLVATLQAASRYGTIGILQGHTDAVESIAFSPVGTTLASASTDQSIRLWTVTPNGHYPLGRPLRAGVPLYSAAFDSTGRTLAAGGFDQIMLWSIPQRKRLAVIPDRAGAVASVAFSHGNMLAAGGSDGTVLLWNLVTHSPKVLHIPGGGVVQSVGFTPDGRVLATSSTDSVVLWDVATHHRLGRPLTGPTGTVSSIAFSPDGRTVAAGGSNGEIAFWDLRTHSPDQPVLGGFRLVNSLAYSRDGHALAAGGASSTVVFKLDGHRPVGERLFGHLGGVNSVAFSANGKFLASSGADETISLWHYPIGTRYGSVLMRHTSGSTKVAVTSTGGLVASAGASGEIFITNPATTTAQRVPALDQGAVEGLSFDPSGHTLAAAYRSGSIVLWDVTRGTQEGVLRGNSTAVLSIAFDRTGTRLVSGARDGTVRLWDVRTHAEIGQRLSGLFGTIYAVAFSANGADIAAGGGGRTIRLWNARTLKPLDPSLITVDAVVFSLAFSPQGGVLASGGADDKIHLWDIKNHGYVPGRVLTGDTNLVRSVAFSPDGQTLASASTDTTVRLWDVATGAELGGPLTGHDRAVESVAFGQNGRLLVSGSIDGTVRSWQGAQPPSSFASLQAQVCSFLGAGLSRAEWSTYAPDIPYQRTCPRTTPS
jgi:WD40 repeat protein